VQGTRSSRVYRIRRYGNNPADNATLVNQPPERLFELGGTRCASPEFMETVIVMMGLLVGSAVTLPTWPYSRTWGYGPTSACAIVVAGIVALILVGRL
jgi:Protein of unknown function (DUF3309)